MTKLTAFEIQDALETFRIICDTREHQIPQAKKRMAAFGVPVNRMALSYGDYCADISVNGRQSLFDGAGSAISPTCVIERKMSLDELAGCFTRSRDRFRREFERASANNATVYLLIENGSWEGIMQQRYRSKLHPEAFKASMIAWMARYHFVPVFCKAESSGALIKEILYRDIKERLEHGEYG